MFISTFIAWFEFCISCSTNHSILVISILFRYLMHVYLFQQFLSYSTHLLTSRATTYLVQNFQHPLATAVHYLLTMQLKQECELYQCTSYTNNLIAINIMIHSHILELSLVCTYYFSIIVPSAHAISVINLSSLVSLFIVMHAFYV